MPKEIINLQRQIQNVIIYDPVKKSGCTLTLMPKRKNGYRKIIQDNQVTQDLLRRADGKNKKLKIKEVAN